MRSLPSSGMIQASSISTISKAIWLLHFGGCENHQITPHTQGPESRVQTLTDKKQLYLQLFLVFQRRGISFERSRDPPACDTNVNIVE